MEGVAVLHTFASGGMVVSDSCWTSCAAVEHCWWAMDCPDSNQQTAGQHLEAIRVL